MQEHNNDLRTTTISLDEYNKLRDTNTFLNEVIGSKDEQIRTLNSQLQTKEEQAPLVKVVHFQEKWGRDYDDWNDDFNEYSYQEQKKVEFVNMTDVTNLAKKEVRKGLETEILDMKGRLKANESTMKLAQEREQELRDLLNKDTKIIKSLKSEQKEALEETEKEYKKNVNQLKKASEEDAKAYKETIKDLKEEIQKVKDSKTDAEIEAKRNKEIVTLKTRIADLEHLIEELGDLSFFKRIFKLRSVSKERLDARVELARREREADNIGTTWVRDNGKVREYNAFESMYYTIFDYGKSMWTSMMSAGIRW